MINDLYKNVGVSEVLSAALDVLGKPSSSINDAMKLIESTSNANWLAIENWEEMSDVQIFQKITLRNPLRENVFIVSDASYSKSRGAFEVNAGKIKEFVSRHLEIFGECLFNGDALFVSAKRDVLLVFHHDGVWASFERDPLIF